MRKVFVPEKNEFEYQFNVSIKGFTNGNEFTKDEWRNFFVIMEFDLDDIMETQIKTENFEMAQIIKELKNDG